MDFVLIEVDSCNQLSASTWNIVIYVWDIVYTMLWLGRIFVWYSHNDSSYCNHTLRQAKQSVNSIAHTVHSLFRFQTNHTIFHLNWISIYNNLTGKVYRVTSIRFKDGLGFNQALILIFTNGITLPMQCKHFKVFTELETPCDPPLGPVLVSISSSVV